jgi:hypothetical protein
MEMQIVGSSPEINLVVQMDRAEGYDAVNGDWLDARRYYVQAAAGRVSSGDFQISQQGFLDNLRTINPDEMGITQEDLDAEIAGIENLAPEEFEQVVLGLGAPPGGAQAVGLQLEALENVGEVDSGDPASLVDFATWAIDRYPAQNYALIMSNHGGGWTGVAFDEASDNNALTMTELDSALAQIVEQSGIGKFDLVAFDACLMAQLEVLKVLVPYADYAIASQEVIPGAGWEYVTPLTALRDNPQASVPEFAQWVIDGYIHYYTNDLSGYEAFDLHVFDLSQVDGVIAALDTFAQAVQANPGDNLIPIGNARNNAQMFSADDPEAADLFSSVDLMDFTRLLIELTTDEAVKSAAQGVMDAVDALEVYGQASPGLPGSHGVAIYFPANPLTFAMGDNHITYREQAPQAMASWLAFLDTFHNTAVETFSPADLTIDITEVLPSGDVASIYDPPVVLFETNGQGIVNLQFFAALQLEDGGQIILDQSPLVFSVFTPDGEEITAFPEGVSQNEFTWNVEMPLVTDGENSVETVLLSNPDSPDDAIIQGIYHWANGESSDSYLIFDMNTAEFVSAWGIQESETGVATSEIRPARGDRFEPVWKFLDANGQLAAMPSGTQLVFGNEPFTYRFVPAASGNYDLTMLVEDMAGNVSVDSVQFSVSNEGLDTAYRGFKDVSMGINFLFPWGWTDPSVTENEDGSYTLSVSDENGDISIIVDAYEVESTDELLDIALGNLEAFGAQFDEPQPFELSDYDADAVYYTYEDESGNARVGAQLVLYIPENGLGYIIDVDGPEAMTDDADQVFNDVIDSITFFPPLE